MFQYAVRREIELPAVEVIKKGGESREYEIMT
jgi:hypothetical protein